MGRSGKAGFKFLPVGSVVVRDVHAVLRRSVQHPSRFGSSRTACTYASSTDAVHDLGPRLAVVLRLPDVRREVVQQRAAHRHVRPAGIERRRVDLAHPTEVGHVRRRDVCPVRPAVSRHVHEPVVGPCPDDVDIHLCRCHGEDRRIHLGTVHVAGDGPSRVAQRAGVGTREVPAQPVPRLAAVRRRHKTVRRRVQRVRDRWLRRRWGRSTATAPPYRWPAHRNRTTDTGSPHERYPSRRLNLSM